MMSKLYLLVAIVCLVSSIVVYSSFFYTEMVEVFPKYKVYEYSEEALTCPDGNKPIHVMVGEDPNVFYITCRELRSLDS